MTPHVCRPRHDGPVRPELAPKTPRPPTVVKRQRVLALPMDGGGRYRVKAPKGALVRDHVEASGTALGLVPHGEDVVALKEAVSSKGLHRVYVVNRDRPGWVSTRARGGVRPARGGRTRRLKPSTRARRS